MTTPRDDIAGLSERLRKTLGCVEPDDFRGDSLAIFIASELEPSIDDETLDDSMTWKQGALDACDRVLDVIHAHYATQLDSLLKERDALRNEINDWANEVARYKSYAEKFDQENAALQAIVKELEAVDTSWRETLRIERGCHLNEVRLKDEYRARALRAEQERDDAYERLKPFADFDHATMSANPDTCVVVQGRVPSTLTLAHFRAARDLVRRLAGPEKA